MPEEITGLQIFDKVQPTQRRYCWTPYIPMRCVTLLQGDPQTAKSTVIRAVAAALSNGLSLPPNDEKHTPMRVMLQNAEDDFTSAIVPHLNALGANMKNCARINEDNAPLFFYDERIEAYIAQFKPQLVIFDTLQRYAGGKINLNDLTVVTALFDYLTNIAKKYDCAVVVVSHLNKQDTKWLYSEFTAARSIISSEYVRFGFDKIFNFSMASSLSDCISL